MGIDDKTFNEGLRVMGNSGNNDESMKGLWGLGFFSFVKVSERILIVTKSRIENKDKAWICKSALSFEELHNEQYDKLEFFGTKLTLVIKDEIDFNNLQEKIEEITKLSGIKTEYYIDNELIELKQFYSLEEYFKNHYHSYFNDKYCVYSLNYLHINNDDYEAFLIHIAGEFESSLRPYECFLLNTPINLDFNESSYTTNFEGCIINIKNERKFEPKPDREDFEQQAENKINSMLNEEAKDFIKPEDNGKKIKSIKEWYDVKDRHFIKQITKDKISLNLQIKTPDHTSYRGSVNYNPMYDVLPREKPDYFLVSRSYRKAGFENIKSGMALKNKVVLCVQSRKKKASWRRTDETDNYDELLDLGFIDFGKFAKLNKIKVNVSKGNGLTKKFVYHGRYNNYYDNVHDTNNSIVFKVKDINSNLDLIRTIKGDHVYFITDNANLKNTKTVEDIPSLIGKDTIFTTTKGLMTFLEFMKKVKQSTVSPRYTTAELNHIGFHNSSPDDEKGITIYLTNEKIIDLVSIYIRHKTQQSFSSVYDCYSFYNYLQKRIESPLLQYLIKNQIDQNDVTMADIKIFRELDKLK